MTASIPIKAHLDTKVVLRAYRELGNRLGKNLVKRAAREALGPVREKVRAAWLAARYREGSAPKRIAIEKKFVMRRASAKQLKKAVEQMYDDYWTQRTGVQVGKKAKPPRTHKVIRRKYRRTKRPQPVVVRRAIARATNIEVDRRSNGTFVAAVGVDYGKAGLKSQQRVMHLLERGRAGARPLAGARVSEKVNQAEQGPTEQRFLRAMEKGILDGVD